VILQGEVQKQIGYEKGAFTGAKSQGQAGNFEAADGGICCTK
jgi:transcriptional regulator with PAS, ATPase and Fis domain